jgi:nucleoredoxin
MSAATTYDIPSLFGGRLSFKGTDVNVDDLSNKVVAIYFSAHWCPPCRQFTPILIKSYESAKALNLPFELIFVSSDHDEEGFDEYTADMPWPSVKFDVSRIMFTTTEQCK